MRFGHPKLASHASRAELRYLHRWRPFDLVMWDNRVLLHRAKSYDMARYRRVFRRTTVARAKGPWSGLLRGQVEARRAINAHEWRLWSRKRSFVC
jgi:alpha-ketoglutarate-dependent taurine dioxygenase